MPVTVTTSRRLVATASVTLSVSGQFTTGGHYLRLYGSVTDPSGATVGVTPAPIGVATADQPYVQLSVNTPVTYAGSAAVLKPGTYSLRFQVSSFGTCGKTPTLDDGTVGYILTGITP